ncbi:MAG: hypothetical protein EHM50_11155, partial [Lysobacterales bacterium]
MGPGDHPRQGLRGPGRARIPPRVRDARRPREEARPERRRRALSRPRGCPLANARRSTPRARCAARGGSPKSLAPLAQGEPTPVVEVSESSLATERGKARIYARAGIREYWIARRVISISASRRGMTGSRDGVSLKARSK